MRKKSKTNNKKEKFIDTQLDELKHERDVSSKQLIEDKQEFAKNISTVIDTEPDIMVNGNYFEEVFKKIYADQMQHEAEEAAMEEKENTENKKSKFVDVIDEANKLKNAEESVKVKNSNTKSTNTVNGGESKENKNKKVSFLDKLLRIL